MALSRSDRCLIIIGVRGVFQNWNPNGVRSNIFLLSIAVGGYLVLSVAVYCFGRGLLPPGPSCDTPECFSRPYAQDPQTLFVFLPGVIIGLLGLVQIWLSRRCSSAANQKLLRMSFLSSAIASVAISLSVALFGAEELDILRGVVGLSAAAFFPLGLLLSLINIGWSLTGPR